MKRHREESPGTLSELSATTARTGRSSCEHILVPLGTARLRALQSQQLKSHVALTAGAKSPRALLAQGAAPHTPRGAGWMPVAGIDSAGTAAGTGCMAKGHTGPCRCDINQEHSLGDKSQRLLQSLLLSYMSTWLLCSTAVLTASLTGSRHACPGQRKPRSGRRGSAPLPAGALRISPTASTTVWGEGGAPGAKLSCFASCESCLLQMPS